MRRRQPAAGPVAARRYAFSTNTGATAVPGRAFVLFFDDVHLTQAEGDRAKVALTQFLERELQAGDLVSLVAPGTALRWHARMPDGPARADPHRAPACAASTCPIRRPIR